MDNRSNAQIVAGIIGIPFIMDQIFLKVHGLLSIQSNRNQRSGNDHYGTRLGV